MKTLRPFLLWWAYSLHMVVTTQESAPNKPHRPFGSILIPSEHCAHNSKIVNILWTLGHNFFRPIVQLNNFIFPSN